MLNFGGQSKEHDSPQISAVFFTRVAVKEPLADARGTHWFPLLRFLPCAALKEFFAANSVLRRSVILLHVNFVCCRFQLRAGSPSTLSRYLAEFKRFWKVYYEWNIHNIDPKVNKTQFQWGINLKAPRMPWHYLQYPYRTLSQMETLAGNLCKQEYLVHVLIALNLMGRDCELGEARYREIDFRENNRVFVQLPDVKKFSSSKVPVELYSYAKEPLLLYLKSRDWKPDDKLFPLKQPGLCKTIKKSV